MARKLISLISTAGKTKEEVVKQTWEAHLKYQETQRKVKSDMGLADDTATKKEYASDVPPLGT